MYHTSQYACVTWDLLDCAVEGLDYFIDLFEADIESQVHTSPTNGPAKEAGPTGQDDNDEEELIV